MLRASQYHLVYVWTGLTHEDWHYEKMRTAALPYALAIAGAITAVTIELAADVQMCDYRATKEYESGGTMRDSL